MCTSAIGAASARLVLSLLLRRGNVSGQSALRLLDVGNGRKPRVSAIDGAVIASSLDHAVSTAQISVADVWDVRRTIEIRTAALAAQNRTDAEARAYQHLAAEVPDFQLTGLTKMKLNEVYFEENSSELWFKCKVSYIVFDEKSQREKKVFPHPYSPRTALKRGRLFPGVVQSFPRAE